MQCNTRFLSKNLALLSLALLVSMTGGVLAGCSQGNMGTEETEENMEEESMGEEESMEEETDTEEENN